MRLLTAGLLPSAALAARVPELLSGFQKHPTKNDIADFNLYISSDLRLILGKGSWRIETILTMRDPGITSDFSRA